MRLFVNAGVLRWGGHFSDSSGPIAALSSLVPPAYYVLIITVLLGNSRMFLLLRSETTTLHRRKLKGPSTDRAVGGPRPRGAGLIRPPPPQAVGRTP